MLKKYEAMFIFSSSLAEEKVAKALQKITDEIVKLKGEVTGTKMDGRRVFARPLNKEREGQYVRVAFGMAPANISPLLARFKLNADIFRSQLVTASPEKKEETVKAVSAE